MEQGLAISAGSLATTRPLFRLIVEKLGWGTRPSAATPSNNGGSALVRLGSSAHPIEAELGFSRVHNKSSSHDLQKGLPLTPDEVVNGKPYRCDISSAGAETDGYQNSGDSHIVVTTHHMQSVCREPHRSESEEYLARTDGRSSR